MSFNSIFDVSASGLKAQSRRLRFVSENIANADTPGYQRKETTFETHWRSQGQVRSGKMRLDATEFERIFDPKHPLADRDGYYDGSNVNIIREMADSREANHSYSANLRIFDQARQMQTELFKLLK